MIKVMLVIFFIFLLFVLIALAPYYIALYQRLNAEKDLLRARWQRARQQRLLWKERHFQSFDFQNIEYQKLWQAEIEAEYLYLKAKGPWGRTESVSTREFNDQRQAFVGSGS